MAVFIIGGCPGTGKTTLSRQLAMDDPQGVHLETDRFFDFIPNKLDPSTPEAKQQNEAVLNAWCAAANSYSNHGYQVYVDGVIGPWWFDQLDIELGHYQYLMLHADLETCLARVANREGQASATTSVVQHMHTQFTDAEKSEIQYLDVSQMDKQVVLDRVKGHFAL